MAVHKYKDDYFISCETRKFSKEREKLDWYDICSRSKNYPSMPPTPPDGKEVSYRVLQTNFKEKSHKYGFDEIRYGCYKKWVPTAETEKTELVF